MISVRAEVAADLYARWRGLLPTMLRSGPQP